MSGVEVLAWALILASSAAVLVWLAIVICVAWSIVEFLVDAWNNRARSTT